MAYCQIADVKPILRIDLDDLTFDAELETCITKAKTLIDGLLEPHDLTIPSPVPQLVADACAYYAAWLFRKPRDPTGAAAFKEEADVFLQAYIDSQSGPAFKVCSA